MTKWCGSVLQTQPHLSTDNCPPSETPMLHVEGWLWSYLVNHWMPVWSACSCCPDWWWGAWRPRVAPSVNGPLQMSREAACSCCPDWWRGVWRPRVAPSVNGPLQMSDVAAVASYHLFSGLRPYWNFTIKWNRHKYSQMYFNAKYWSKSNLIVNTKWKSIDILNNYSGKCKHMSDTF